MGPQRGRYASLGTPPTSPKHIRILCLSLVYHGTGEVGILGTHLFNEWISRLEHARCQGWELTACNGKQPLTAFGRSEPFGRDSFAIDFMVQPDFKGLWGLFSRGFSSKMPPHCTYSVTLSFQRFLLALNPSRQLRRSFCFSLSPFPCFSSLYIWPSSFLFDVLTHRLASGL